MTLNETAKQKIRYYVFLTVRGLTSKHVVLLCVTCSLRSVMARGLLYLIVHIICITLYVPEQDAVQLRSHIFPVKPKAHPGDCRIP